ncbi:MAG: DUF5655 domain-containing protein [Pseudomonadota bacterium]
MSNPEAALATQLKNIESRTGKTLDELRQMIAASGLAKHGEVRSWLMAELGLGYGDANTVVHLAKQADTPAAADATDPLDAIYTGAKAGLRPLHEAAMAGIQALGPFEIAPKKSYLSLRRKKQFAMLGPATKDQLELGLNAKDLPAHPRLKALPPGGMCQYTVRLSQAAELDDTLLGWVRAAYDAAG